MYNLFIIIQNVFSDLLIHSINACRNLNKNIVFGEREKLYVKRLLRCILNWKNETFNEFLIVNDLNIYFITRQI